VISITLGPNSATTVGELLAAKPSPAPLGLLRFDYSQLGELMASLDDENRADANARELMTALGLMEIKLVAGDRGVAGWLSFELR
jgi:hypothetical protein